MRIVIVGVGDIGLELAGNLAKKGENELVLVDVDEDRCDTLSKKMDALVICGDGTDPDILEKAQVPDADALVATTGDDPINTVIAMLGDRLDVDRIIVKLNGLGLQPACQAIGVRKVIAPKVAAVANIESALYGPEEVDFSMIARGGLRLLNYGVRQLGMEKLSDLDLPKGASLTAVLRSEDVLVPQDDLTIEKDDSLLILVENEDVKAKLDDRVSQHEKQKNKDSSKGKNDDEGE